MPCQISGPVPELCREPADSGTAGGTTQALEVGQAYSSSPLPWAQTTCCASWLRAAHAQKPPAICKTVSEQTVHAVTEIVHCISPRFSNPGSHPHYQRIMVTDLDGQEEQPLPLPMRTWRPAHQGVSGSAGLRRQRTPLPLLVNPNSRSGSLHP